MKLNKKISLIVIIIIAAVGGAVAWYYYQQSQKSWLERSAEKTTNAFNELAK